MFKRFFLFATLLLACSSTLAQSSGSGSSTSTTPASSSLTTEVPATGVSGQSTAPLNPEAAQERTWGVALVSETDMLASSLHYSNNKDKSLENFSYVGITYNPNKRNVFGLRQYSDFKRDGESSLNTTEVSDTALTYTRTFDGFASSDPISAMFWYYAPFKKLSRDVNSNGTLRADVEFVWTLNPRISVAYYANPRQSFIPSPVTLGEGEDAKDYFAKSTLIHWAAAYYNVSDSQIYYINAGMRDDWATRDSFGNVNEQALLNVGANYKFFSDILSVNPEIDYATPEGPAGSGLIASNYSEDNLTYLMTVGVAF